MTQFKKSLIIIVIILFIFLFKPIKVKQLDVDDINLPARNEGLVKPLKKDKLNHIPQVCGLSVVNCDNDTENKDNFSVIVNDTDIVKELSAEYDVDWKLIEAIVIHETGNRTSLAYRNKNNVGGLMGREGLMTFESTYDSYKFMINMIKKYYIDMGLTTIEQIGRKYAPIGATNDPTGLNNHWVRGVTNIYNNLKE